MKRSTWVYVLALWAVCALAGPPRCSGQENSEPIDPFGPAPSAREPLGQRIQRLWFERKQLLDQGDGARAQAKYLELVDLRDQSGVPALPEQSRALVAEALEAHRAGDSARAQRWLDAAAELDPGSPDPWEAMAVVRGGDLAPGALMARVRALTIRLRAFFGATTLGAQALVTLTLALVVAAVLGLLALMVRHQPQFRHEIWERFRKRHSQEMAGFLGWALLALPLVLTFDLAWAATVWGLLAWKFLEGKERVIAILCLLSIGLAPALLSVAERLARAPSDAYVRAAAEYMGGLPGGQTVAQLESVAAAGGEPDDSMLLGLVYERQGRPREAIEVYRRLEKEPGYATQALTNLGNIHYRLDEKDKALESWQAAEKQDPEFAPLLYNMSIYYLDQFQFEKRDEYFARFSAVASSRLKESAGGDEEQELLSAGLDPAEVWRRVLEGRTRSVEPMDTAAEPVAAVLGTPLALAALAVALVNLVLRGRQRLDRAKACVKCGQSYCPQCNASQDDQAYCLQCVHLFIKRDGVSPQMRADKVGDIKRHEGRRRLFSWLLAVIPGATQIFTERTFEGYLMLLAWSLGLALILVGAHGLTEPTLGLAGSPSLGTLLGWVLVALLWLVSLLRARTAAD